MPLVAARANAGAFGLGWSAATEEPYVDLGGFVLMTPTSINYSGTSATISTNGSVSFSNVTSLSLNGVFTDTYDNYLMMFRYRFTSAGYPTLRYRSGGTDFSSSSFYNQTLGGNTSIFTQSYGPVNEVYLSYSSGATNRIVNSTVFIYGPKLPQDTVAREFEVRDYNGIGMSDDGIVWYGTDQFDGLSLYAYSGAGQYMNGSVAIYGLVGS